MSVNKCLKNKFFREINIIFTCKIFFIINLIYFRKNMFQKVLTDLSHFYPIVFS